MADAALTLNAGSSSIKFSLFELDDIDQLKLVAAGQVEGIGSAPHFIAHAPAGAVLAEQRWSDAAQSFGPFLETVIEWAEDHLGANTLIAVGHRVVHGGPDHVRPERLCENAPKHDPGSEEAHVLDYTGECFFGRRVAFRAERDPSSTGNIFILSVLCEIHPLGQFSKRFHTDIGQRLNNLLGNDT